MVVVIRFVDGVELQLDLLLELTLAGGVGDSVKERREGKV